MPASGSRLAGIEGLRAIAALAVLTGHVWQFAAPHGTDFGALNNAFFGNLAQGLTLFFVLSGFLLYRPFAKALLRGAPLPRIAAYARNRALRILPAYWVILLLAQAAGATAVDNNPGLSGVGRMDAATFVPNFLLIQNYIPAANGTGISPSWSLVVEVVFYICLPLLAIAAFRLLANGRSVAVCVLTPPAVLLIPGLCGRFWAVSIDAPTADLASWAGVLERSFLPSADLFAIGMAAAVLVALVETRKPPWASHVARRAGVCAIVAGLAAIAAQHTFLNAWLLTDLVAVAAASTVVWVVSSPASSRGRRALDSRPARWVGDVSYPVYLWHVPVILWLRAHDLTLDGRAGFFVNQAFVVGIVLLLSGLTHRFVERPAMRRKRRMTGRPVEVEPAVSG